MKASKSKTWTLSNAWMACAASFSCMEVQHCKEHLLLSTIIRDTALRQAWQSRPCVCTRGEADWPLHPIILCMRKTWLRRCRGGRDQLLCGIAAELAVLNQCGCCTTHLRLNIPAKYVRVAACFYQSSMFMLQCSHVILQEGCWQISTFLPNAINEAVFSLTVTQKRVLFDQDLTSDRPHEAALKSSKAASFHWSNIVNLRDWVLLSQGVEIIPTFSYF